MSMTLKRKCRHFDEILITGCTGSCHFDNFQCSQWWKFHQNEDISVSVDISTNLGVYWFKQSNVTTLFLWVMAVMANQTVVIMPVVFLQANGPWFLLCLINVIIVSMYTTAVCLWARFMLTFGHISDIYESHSQCFRCLHALQVVSNIMLVFMTILCLWKIMNIIFILMPVIFLQNMMNITVVLMYGSLPGPDCNEEMWVEDQDGNRFLEYCSPLTRVLFHEVLFVSNMKLRFVRRSIPDDFDPEDAIKVWYGLEGETIWMYPGLLS